MDVEKPREVSVKIGCFVGDVRKAFAVHLLAISLIACGQFVLISLQTSLNVEEGLGKIVNFKCLKFNLFSLKGYETYGLQIWFEDSWRRAHIILKKPIHFEK